MVGASIEVWIKCSWNTNKKEMSSAWEDQKKWLCGIILICPPPHLLSPPALYPRELTVVDCTTMFPCSWVGQWTLPAGQPRTCRDRLSTYFPRSFPTLLQFGTDYIPLSKASSSILKSQVIRGHCSLTCFLGPFGRRLPFLLASEGSAVFVSSQPFVNNFSITSFQHESDQISVEEGVVKKTLEQGSQLESCWDLEFMLEHALGQW